MGMFSTLTGGPSLLGLDIGSQSIKLVQFEQTREGLAVRRAGSTPTPKDALRNGAVADTVAVAEAISSLLEALNVDVDTAVTAVSGPTVVVRQVQLPVMSEKVLRKSIQWEARNYISFPVEDSIVEFQIVSNGHSSDPGKMDVMIVACPRDMVDSRVEALELAGLEPTAVEIEPFATVRSLVEWSGDAELANQTVALVGIGAAYADINIVKDRSFVLSRVIPIAGNSFTEAIATTLSLTPEEANTLKETGLQLVTSEEERATLDPMAQQASRAVEPLLEELTREVTRSLAYYDYQQQQPEAREEQGSVHRIILSGGSAKLANLDGYLRSQVNVPVTAPDVFSQGKVLAPASSKNYLQEHACELVVSSGLALREFMLTKATRH